MLAGPQRGSRSAQRYSAGFCTAVTFVSEVTGSSPSNPGMPLGSCFFAIFGSGAVDEAAMAMGHVASGFEHTLSSPGFSGGKSPH